MRRHAGLAVGIWRCSRWPSSGHRHSAPGRRRRRLSSRPAWTSFEVAATVTDDDGRFISGLTRDDFIVYDDGKPQEIVTFSSERVPVSLGMLLDVSVSMTEDQLATARAAIDPFVNAARQRRRAVPDGVRRARAHAPELDPGSRGVQAGARAGEPGPLTPTDQGQSAVADFINSGTAVFDAVATSLGFAAQGVHPKKAVLVISDGVDTSSRRNVKQVQDAIRASEVLVYALGVEGGSSVFGLLGEGRVDARALRKLTDDTGGRTEVVERLQESGQGHRASRRRVQSAVRDWLCRPRTGWPLAHDQGRGAQEGIKGSRASGIRRVL